MGPWLGACDAAPRRGPFADEGVAGEELDDDVVLDDAESDGAAAEADDDADEASEDVAADDDDPVDGTSEDGTPEDRTSEDATSDDGAPDAGASDDGASDDGAEVADAVAPAVAGWVVGVLSAGVGAGSAIAVGATAKTVARPATPAPASRLLISGRSNGRR